MSASADKAPRCLAHGPGALALLLAGTPTLWLLVVLLRAFARWLRRHHERGTLGRRANANIHAFRKARSLAARDPSGAAAAATGAARVALAAKLGMETVSLTVPEMRDVLSRRGVADETIDALCSAFEDLERLSYAPSADGGQSARDTIDRLGAALQGVFSALRVVVAAALFLCALPRCAEGAGRSPDPFEWERAGQSVAAAANATDFLAAAGMYYAMVTNGASSGPLLYNLGTALLAAGQKAAAAESLVAAERRLGMTDEVTDNLRLALADNGAAGHLPVSRVFLFWHYGPSFATRIDLAVLGWAAFWAALAVSTLVGKGRRMRFARAAARVVAGVSLLLFAAYGASVAVTAMQGRHIDLPRVAGALVAPRPGAAAAGEEVAP